jgi:hypothetical protein
MRHAGLTAATVALAGLLVGANASAQPCTGNACRGIDLNVIERCVWVTNSGGRPAIAELRWRGEVIPVALEAPDASKIPGATPPSAQEQRRAADCAGFERSKAMLDRTRAQGANIPLGNIDRAVAECRANPPAGAVAATTPEQGQHDRKYEALLGRDRPIFRVRPQAPGGACIAALTEVTAYAANESNVASLAAVRQQAAAVAAKPALAAVAPTVVVPKCPDARSTVAAPASYKGPYAEIGVVRRIIGIPVNLDYEAVKAELQKLGRPMTERAGVLSLSVESKCASDTVQFYFTDDKKQLYSAGITWEGITEVEARAALDAVEAEFGARWYEKTVTTSTGTTVFRYWQCVDPPPAYTDAAEVFLSDRCHYVARFDVPSRLSVSYINQSVRRAYDQARSRR